MIQKPIRQSRMGFFYCLLSYNMENKPFIIRCKCGWTEMTTGIAADIKHLKEVTGCSSCGKPRTFRCLSCGRNVKMLRVGARRG